MVRAWTREKIVLKRRFNSESCRNLVTLAAVFPKSRVRTRARVYALVSIVGEGRRIETSVGKLTTIFRIVYCLHVRPSSLDKRQTSPSSL